MAAARSLGRRALGALMWLVLLVLLLLLGVSAWVWWGMQRSRPVLEGSVAAAELSAPVTVARDAAGVATVTAATRSDLAGLARQHQEGGLEGVLGRVRVGHQPATQPVHPRAVPADQFGKRRLIVSTHEPTQ